MSSPKKAAKCPLCERVRRSFICVKCIHSGDYTKSIMVFGHHCPSGTVDRDDKVDPSKRWTMKDREGYSQLMETEQKRMNERFEELIVKFKEIEEIESFIAEYEFKIAYIKDLIELRKSETLAAEERSRSIIRHGKRIQARFEAMTENNKNTSNAIDHSNRRLELHRAAREKLEAEVKQKNKEHLVKLQEEIFPFKTWHQEYPGLADVDKPPRILHNGYTIFRQPSANWADKPQLCCIVESWIPGKSGVFSYANYISICQQRDKLNQDFNLRLRKKVSARNNPAYRVSGALANASQLLSVAYSFLNMPLPKKQSYMDWYIPCPFECLETFPTSEEIYHNAAKLNANLTFLCHHQNVPTQYLHPTFTGNNLWMLFDSSNPDLGRMGPVVIPQDLHQNIENSLLPDHNLCYSKDYEEILFNDEELSDWEAIPRSSVFQPCQGNKNANSESILTNVAETFYNAVTSFIGR